MQFRVCLVLAVVLGRATAGDWCCRNGIYYETDAKAKTAYGENVKGNCNAGKCSVFIAEVQEGSGYNKLLELFNPASEDISLKGYSLVFYHNGADSRPYRTVPLDSYTLKARGSWTICNPRHTALNRDGCGSNCIKCDLESTSMAMNGDDTAELNYQADSNAALTLIDTFGKKGTRDKWTICGVRGASVDNTVLRKATVTRGEPDWAKSAGRNCGDCQWQVMPKDYMLDAGVHLHWGATMAGSVPSSGLPFLQFSDAATDNSKNKVSCENFKTAFAGRILEECTEEKLGLGDVACVQGSSNALVNSRGTKGTPSEDATYMVFKGSSACKRFAAALKKKIATKDGKEAFALGCDTWSEDDGLSFGWVANNYMDSNSDAVKALNTFVEDGSLPVFETSRTTTAAAATTTKSAGNGDDDATTTAANYELAPDGVCEEAPNNDADGNEICYRYVDAQGRQCECPGLDPKADEHHCDDDCRSSSMPPTTTAATTAATTTATTVATVTTETKTETTETTITSTTTQTTVTTARRCLAGEFLDATRNSCEACPSGTYRSETEHSLNECVVHSTQCLAGEYSVKGSASAVNDLACKTSEPCLATQYETKAPVDGASERECTALSKCAALEYVKVSATKTSDQMCAPCADDASSRGAAACRGTTATTTTVTTKTATTTTTTTTLTSTTVTTTTTTDTRTSTTESTTTTNTAEAAAAASSAAAAAAAAATKQTTNTTVVVVAVLIVLVVAVAAVVVLKKNGAPEQSGGVDGEHVSFENPLYAADNAADSYANGDDTGGGASGYMDVAVTNTAGSGYMDVAPNATPAGGTASGYMDVTPTAASIDPDGFTDDEEV